ncbi:hypothetical protein CKF54_07685 [Psittacicella hinzii]|uniref:4'-phosphopantetheinyl transferase domain-containing protein n=1 Tax=Psittacicella hinzii TaxID=2028575 RepID=A0A3A1Y500_9GAMM|nr:4'-phosphopantetheinyl transferase superfamily protein [Psittacicella hinzii]RIY31094.1 hypothetical protein CKF54_07685 [Psittacicella hinzii]
MQAKLFIFKFATEEFTNFWNQLTLNVLGLPAYRELPRTDLGRPFLKKALEVLTSQAQGVFSVEKILQKPSYLIDFNLSNSNGITAISLLIADKEFIPTPLLGIDIEPSKTSLKISEKAFLKKIIHPQNLIHYQSSQLAKEKIIAVEWITKEAIVKSLASSIFRGNRIKFTPKAIEENIFSITEEKSNKYHNEGFVYTFVNYTDINFSICLNNISIFNDLEIYFNNKKLALDSYTNHFDFLYSYNSDKANLNSSILLFSHLYSP